VSDYYIAERMYKPPHFRIAPLVRGRGKRKVVVIGWDSEQDTETGHPMLFQFSRLGERDDVELRVIPEDPRKALDVFITYVDLTCRQKATEYLIFGFNLSYEWTQLFGHLPINPDTGRPIGAEDEFGLHIEHRRDNGEVTIYDINVANNSRYFATIFQPSTKRRIRILDARAFYTTSLDGAAAMLDLPRKLDMASKRFTRADLDNPLFLEYARQDAYITRRVGEAIVSMHEDFDVPTTITAPHFASCVFRRHFLTAQIPLPSSELEQAGLYAYHGGKNGYYLAEPKHMTNVYAYDITSAYPEAMRQLPDPEQATWEYVESYEPGVHALWNVTGLYRSCKYRGLMRHENAWHDTGAITDAWVTSYELDAAIAEGELSDVTCHGWVMRGPTGQGPLVRYVDRFFDMKRTSTGAARVAAKLFLNSLYGKFFQKVPLGDVGSYDIDETGDVTHVEYNKHNTQGDFDYQAGGLYHPPIAALITGFVRAKMHHLEHRYGSLMTSTDGLFAIHPPEDGDIGDDLGLLTVERGDLSIWRERLYDFTPRNGGKSKYALHGFRGNVDDLRRIPLTPGAYSYKAQQVITTKLAGRAYRGERYGPGTFATMTFVLDLTMTEGP
jgi:DNA polymerase family B